MSSGEKDPEALGRGFFGAFFLDSNLATGAKVSS